MLWEVLEMMSMEIISAIPIHPVIPFSILKTILDTK